MQAFEFKINIAAESREAAKEKVKAALSMINNLETEQLIGLSNFVEEAPEQVAKITDLIKNGDKTAVLTTAAKMAAEELKNMASKKVKGMFS